MFAALTIVACMGYYGMVVSRRQPACCRLEAAALQRCSASRLQLQALILSVDDDVGTSQRKLATAVSAGPRAGARSYSRASYLNTDYSIQAAVTLNALAFTYGIYATLY